MSKMVMKLVLAICWTGLSVGYANGQGGHCDAGTKICTVPAPVSAPGTFDDANITKTIAEAVSRGYQVVEFPAGTYTITSAISLLGKEIDLRIRGAGVGRTIIQPAILAKAPFKSPPFFPIFNVDGPTKTNIQLEISGFTLEMDHLASHPAYVMSNVTTGNAHGVRVGTGWGLTDPDGWMLIKNMRIEGPPGYGVGLQTRNARAPFDEPANNVTIEGVAIFRSGSDGIDVKEGNDSRGNKVSPENLTIRGVLVDTFGLNEKDPTQRRNPNASSTDATQTAANAFDIRANGVYIEKITAIGTGKVTAAHSLHSTTSPNRLVTTTNNGLNFRDSTRIGSDQSGSLAYIHDLHVVGTHNAINFGHRANENVMINNFILQDYSAFGINIRGSDHIIEHGCILPGASESPGFINYVSGEHDLASLDIDDVRTGSYDAVLCPAYTEVGHGAF
jgi:hypothetical protein